MAEQQQLAEKIKQHFGDKVDNIHIKDMVTVELHPQHLIEVCTALRDQEPFSFEQLVDVCGVDYLEYGIAQWRTEKTTETGFDRGVDVDFDDRVIPWDKPRFASVYHLLSVTHNHRVRLKVYLQEEDLFIPSVIDLWPSADWYEREAFDLYGIVYEGHPDLRRLLTDYGFKGHPFRKDFPLIGEVELRYDAAKQACVYEPVSIQPRVLVPKVIRQDHRYLHTENEEGNPNA
jgi:NADH-quinone oxidoreductase subunit C